MSSLPSISHRLFVAALKDEPAARPGRAAARAIPPVATDEAQDILGCAGTNAFHPNVNTFTARSQTVSPRNPGPSPS